MDYLIRAYVHGTSDAAQLFVILSNLTMRFPQFDHSDGSPDADRTVLTRLHQMITGFSCGYARFVHSHFKTSPDGMGTVFCRTLSEEF